MPADTAAVTAGADTPENIEAKERRSGWRTIRKVAPYLWSDTMPWAKRRVILRAGAFVSVEARRNFHAIYL